MKKVTIADIAKKAGVGTATVERVLNERGNVSQKTATKVIIAAKKSGYRRLLPESYKGLIRIEVILIRPDTSFFREMGDAYARISRILDRNVSLHRTYVDEGDLESMVHAISRPAYVRSGLIVVAPDKPEIINCLEREAKKGAKIVTIVSEISTSEPIPHVGIDNYSAGRTAAQLMDRMSLPDGGEFIALCHSGAYSGHRDRVRGFSDYFQEHPSPNHEFTTVYLMFDDKYQCETILGQALLDKERISGVYNTGGASVGVANALREYVWKESVFWVGHELTGLNRKLLDDNSIDIIIDQNPDLQARHSIDLMLSQLGIGALDIPNKPIPFQLITKESIAKKLTGNS
ncbi:MAG: LacI family DNA-binding transcriptional regulator [Rhizobiaceae bacterium]|nr:LacI family DNA-binding transcriptional regulator [Rhizobiaceae bacterium]